MDSSFFHDQITNHYQYEKCHLDHDPKRPWTLLFAVILSAQCTDKRVNATTPKLFSTFPSLEHYAARPIEELENIIRPLGFFRSKSKSLKNAAQKLILDFKGLVPNSMEELTSLPGVGRKTANVILWNLFEKNVGFVVDTHVGRIAQRTGLSTNHTPEKIEKDLMKCLPQKDWGRLSHMLVQFGRDTCSAPTPKCSKCFLKEKCPQKGVKKSN